MLREAIYTILNSVTPNNYHLEVPQRQERSEPHIVWRIRNIDPEHTKEEQSVANFPALDLDIYGANTVAVETLSLLVEATFENVRGAYNGVNITSIVYEGEMEDFDKQLKLYRIYQEYKVRIN